MGLLILLSVFNNMPNHRIIQQRFAALKLKVQIMLW